MYSEKTDVWAFGVTMIEILSRSTPYGDENPVTAAALGFLPFLYKFFFFEFWFFFNFQQCQLVNWCLLFPALSTRM